MLFDYTATFSNSSVVRNFVIMVMPFPYFHIHYTPNVITNIVILFWIINTLYLFRIITNSTFY